MITCFSSQFLLKIAFFFFSPFSWKQVFIAGLWSVYVGICCRRYCLASPLFPPPPPQNAGCRWPFVAVAVCPQTCGQCLMGTQPGRLSAGRGTAGETTSMRGQPRHPPWKPQAGATDFKRTLRIPVARHPLGSRLRFGEKVWADPGFDVCGSCAVLQRFGASRSGAPRCPAVRSVGHQHQTWEEELKSIATRARPSGLPHLSFSRVTPLQTPRATVASETELSKRPRAGGATLSPHHDHGDTITCWCCRFGHSICPGHGPPRPQLHPQDRAGPIRRLVWGLFSYFGYFTTWVCSGCVTPSATSNLCMP